MILRVKVDSICSRPICVFVFVAAKIAVDLPKPWILAQHPYLPPPNPRCALDRQMARIAVANMGANKAQVSFGGAVRLHRSGSTPTGHILCTGTGVQSSTHKESGTSAPIYGWACPCPYSEVLIEAQLRFCGLYLFCFSKGDKVRLRGPWLPSSQQTLIVKVFLLFGAPSKWWFSFWCSFNINQQKGTLTKSRRMTSALYAVGRLQVDESSAQAHWQSQRMRPDTWTHSWRPYREGSIGH